MGRPIFIAKQGTGLHDGLKGVPISSPFPFWYGIPDLFFSWAFRT